MRTITSYRNVPDIRGIFADRPVRRKTSQAGPIVDRLVAFQSCVLSRQTASDLALGFRIGGEVGGNHEPVMVVKARRSVRDSGWVRQAKICR